MTLDLQTFKESLGNVVRPNRFEVIIQPPSLIDIADYIDGTRLMMRVQSATIPDRTFGEIPIKFYGMEMKIPASEIMQDLVISFINDDKWQLRSLFEYWAQLINDRKNSVKGYAKDLMEDTYIIVRQLGFTNDVIAGYRFKLVFPKTVDPIELNMETTDTIETFTVTFAYGYWEPESQSSEPTEQPEQMGE